MPVCRNTLKQLALSFLIGLLPCVAHASSVGVEVQSVEMVKLPERKWRLSAYLVFRLSDVARDAVLHGVPLYWQVYVQWRKPRRFWWDKVLLEKSIQLKLQYHALLNQFSIQTNKTEAEMFSSLSEVLHAIGRLKLTLNQPDGALVNGSDKLAIKAVFEREALPAPLRPVAWLDKQWDLSSDWSIWPIQK